MNKNTIKPEMTVEAKARFFAQYWGQKVQSYKLTYSWRRNVEVNGDSLGFLTLKPLSSITDEDAIDVAKLNADVDEYLPGMGNEKAMRYGRNNIYFLSLRTETSDFLRSRGYALPFMGWSVEQMVEAGWIKLKGGANNG